MERQPAIKATFRLDTQGKPLRIQQGDQKHYEIRLHVEGAPEDTYAVTYLLHETYYEPVRESVNAVQNFAEDLTSYGDYTVQAKLRTKQGIVTIASPLSQALAEGHQGQCTPAIEAALKDISSN
jgi:hypothetical protein